MKLREPGEDRDGAHSDSIFRSMTASPDLRALDRAGDREGVRRDVRRIASTLFCSVDIDPSIVTFVKARTALHWGLTEDAVDVMVTGRLLQKTASLIGDLQWLRTEQPLVGLA